MRLFLILSLLFITACAPPVSQITRLPDASAPDDIPVFFATSRAPDLVLRYGADRSEVTGYGRYDVSVPPAHESGQIEWPRRTPDELQHFVATSENLYPGPAEFRHALSQELRKRPRGKRTATIYVHGFLNSFADGIYRMAQLSHDFESPDVSVHYSWPSASHPLGYLHDRDSMLFARRGLEELIHEVKAAGAEEILLVGHSMGGLLSMEVIRTMALRNSRQMFGMIDGVVLISADIDVDVFRNQLHDIGDLPDPLLLITSDRDPILRLSAWITGLDQRVGTLQGPEDVSDFEVLVINTGDYTTRGGHFNVGNSPELIKTMQRMQGVVASLSDQSDSRAGVGAGAVLIVQNAAQILLPAVN